MPYGSGKGINTVGGTFDGGGATPTPGAQFRFVSQAGGMIDRWDIVADRVGNCVIDVWKLFQAIPTIADTIFGTVTKPTLAAAQLGTLSIVMSQQIAVRAGDVFIFNLDSVATIQIVTVELRIR